MAADLPSPGTAAGKSVAGGGLAVGIRGAVLSLALALAGTIAGCSWTEGLFDWIDPTPTAPEKVAAPSEEEAEYPNLAEVPDTAPEVTPPAERGELEAGLAEDRAESKMVETPEAKAEAAMAEAEKSKAEPLSQKAMIEESQRQQEAFRAEVSAFAERPLYRSGSLTSGVLAAPVDGNGLKVGVDGRSPGEMVAIVYFGHGSTGISANDRAVIDEVARLQKATGRRLWVVGHASSRTGTVDRVKHQTANFEVSLKRANAVAAALARAGVPSGAIEVAAMGDSAPVYHEFMPTGEAGNRRAEIYLDR